MIATIAERSGRFLVFASVARGATSVSSFRQMIDPET